MPAVNDPYDLIVVGGGPAGYFGAIACAEAHPGARILILEKSKALLAKVLISGGGRCNVTHACFEPARLVEYYPRGRNELRGPFSRFQPADTLRWFESHHLALKTEADGRVFPVSDRSQSVVDCLTYTASQYHIDVRTLAPVTDVHLLPDSPQRFEVLMRSGERLTTRNLLLACGGDRQGYPLAEQLGHTINAPVPSLFTFEIKDPRLDGLPGLAVEDVHLSLPDAKLESHGPLLITHWGVSGPAVLRLSAWAARPLAECGYQARLLINWLPGFHADALYHRLAGFQTELPQQKVSFRDPLGKLPQRLWQRLVQQTGIDEHQMWGTCGSKRLINLAGQLTRGQFNITGKGEFKDEFVTCGGVKLTEVDLRSMQSRLVPGLFLAGEVLDIDGLTGGFNFQNAWTTGWLAGQNIDFSPDDGA